jgi:hypothetical protein
MWVFQSQGGNFGNFILFLIDEWILNFVHKWVKVSCMGRICFLVMLVGIMYWFRKMLLYPMWLGVLFLFMPYKSMSFSLWSLRGSSPA